MATLNVLLGYGSTMKQTNFFFFSLDFSSCFFFFSFLVLWSNGKMWQFPRKGGKNIDGS
jgi:hypothetical protein